MSTFEGAPAPSGEASNSRILYSGLIGMLLGPAATWSDAHYYHFDLPPADGFAGALAEADDYHAYQLRASQELIESQREANMAALDAGHETLPFSYYGATQANRRDFLERGLACIYVKLAVIGESEQCSLVVARPGDLIPEDPLTRQIVARMGADHSPGQPLVYDLGSGRIPDEPFTEPHLVALYRHLHESGA